MAVHRQLLEMVAVEMHRVGHAGLVAHLDLDALKKELKKIEAGLGRERTTNKNAPRTMDLDILIYNDIAIDSDIYEREYLRDSIVELLPHFFEENPKPNA